jgi:predicted alpha/beta-fold hydrolase
MIKKFVIITFITLFISFIFYKTANSQYIPDLFSPYMQGAEAARAANARDAYNYQQITIQQAILMFNKTKNFDYLCIAYLHGSQEAANYLFDHDYRCITK